MKIKRISIQERRGCLGKTKHNSELAAKNHLEELSKFSKTPETLCYYPCKYCKGWHCGNNKTID